MFWELFEVVTYKPPGYCNSLLEGYRYTSRHIIPPGYCNSLREEYYSLNGFELFLLRCEPFEVKQHSNLSVVVVFVVYPLDHGRKPH